MTNLTKAKKKPTTTRTITKHLSLINLKKKRKKLLTQVKATYLPFSLGILYTDFPNLYLQCCSKFLKKQRHLSLLRNDYWLF